MKILNRQRYQILKDLFYQNKINLSDEEIAIYSNVFEIISQFIHNKLSTEELFVVYDYLSDVLQGKKTEIAVSVPKSERIRTQVRLMEEIPETSNKLTLDEKIALAYCVYTGECVQFYDEKHEMICNGNALFDSFEHIRKEFEYERQQFPSIFNCTESYTNEINDDFGFSAENPIGTTSVDASYNYLFRLRYDGKPISYNRLGSLRNSKGDIIDKYDVFFIKKIVFSKQAVPIGRIFINAYCETTSEIAPKGFTLI